jgi:hypothetical protein
VVDSSKEDFVGKDAGAHPEEGVPIWWAYRRKENVPPAPATRW